LKNLSILICDFSLFGIDNIKNIIVDILASLSFNIPTFIYIKHIEKKVEKENMSLSNTNTYNDKK